MPRILGTPLVKAVAMSFMSLVALEKGWAAKFGLCGQAWTRQENTSKSK
jgi:hypothetical protein